MAKDKPKDKPKDKNELVLVAFFDNENLGDDAVLWLKNWDNFEEKVKLGSIGTIVKKNGKIETHVGRKTGKGAAVGTVVGIIAAILSGGLTLVGGVVVGSATGGVAGAFMKKSTHLTKAEIDEIAQELEAGRVALVVTCDEDEVAPTRQQLIKMGGTVRNYAVPPEALTEGAGRAPDSSVGASAPTIAPASDVQDPTETFTSSTN